MYLLKKKSCISRLMQFEPMYSKATCKLFKCFPNFIGHRSFSCLLGMSFYSFMPWVGFPDGSVVIYLPKQEPWVQFLGWEMATHSSILAWKSPWTESGGYSPWGCKESDTTDVTELVCLKRWYKLSNSSAEVFEINSGLTTLKKF